MKTKPSKVILLCAAALVFGIILIAIDELPEWRIPLAAALAVYLVISVRVIATGLVIASLLFTPPQAKAAGVGVTVVVVIGGGYAVVTLYKYCKRKFPKTPPAQTNQVGLAELDMQYAAAFNVPSYVYCFDDGDENPTVTEVTFVCDDDLIAITEWKTSQDSVSREDFEDRLNALGIGIPDQGGSMFGVNGLPATSGPIKLNTTHMIPVIDNAVRTVEVQSSIDLKGWSTIVSLRVPDGMPIKILDCSGGSTVFFRVKSL